MHYESTSHLLITVVVDFVIWWGSAGFPRLLKHHWNSDLFQDHGKIIEFQEKRLKCVKVKKNMEKNHWILVESFIENITEFWNRHSFD